MESVRIGTYDEAQFLAFTRKLIDDRKWELIGGEPIRREVQTLRHGSIVTSFKRLLLEALEALPGTMDVFSSADLRHPSDPKFRPVADLAIVDFDVETIDFDECFFDRCYLAAEVIDDEIASLNEEIKLRRYRELTDCSDVFSIHSSQLCARHWARSTDWAETVYTDPDDLIELPEFGFSCRLRDLYARTDLA